MTALILGVACDDEQGAKLLPLSEWVHAFDSTCANSVAALRAPGLTAEEQATIQAEALAEMRSVALPADKADIASRLLADIEASSRPGLNDAAVVELERRIRAAAVELGVSDKCVGGG
jgi:hypothetical protein